MEFEIKDTEMSKLYLNKAIIFFKSNIYISIPKNDIVINLTKYVNDLYEENHETLMNNTKELHRRRYNPVHE